MNPEVLCPTCTSTIRPHVNYSLRSIRCEDCKGHGKVSPEKAAEILSRPKAAQELHNIVYPCSVKTLGDSQWIVIDGEGKYVCNTLSGNDKANAEFVAFALNAALYEVK